VVRESDDRGTGRGSRPRAGSEDRAGPDHWSGLTDSDPALVRGATTEAATPLQPVGVAGAEAAPGCGTVGSGDRAPAGASRCAEVEIRERRRERRGEAGVVAAQCGGREVAGLRSDRSVGGGGV